MLVLGSLLLLLVFLFGLFFIFLSLNLSLDVVPESHEQTLVPVCACEVSNGSSVFHKFQQVFVIFDCLFGNFVVHWCHRETVDLLDDGIRLLLIRFPAFITLSFVSLKFRSKIIRRIVLDQSTSSF